MSNSSADITTRPPLVEFTNRFVQPTAAQYLTRDDLLWVQLAMSAAPGLAVIGARILAPSGEVVFWERQLVANTPRVAAIGTFDLLEGFLLGVSMVSVAPFGANDWAYAVLGLTRNEGGLSSISQVFTKGYFEFHQPLQWPGGRAQSPFDGKGALRREVGDVPAAGAEWSISVPVGARWRPIALEVELVTSAAAGQRRLSVQGMRGADRLFRVVSPTTQAPSVTRQYHGAHWGVPDVLAATFMPVNLPERIELVAGDTLESLTTALVAGDNYGAPILYVEEWYQAP